MKTHTIKTPTAELMIVELQTEVINSSYHIQKTPKGILIKDDTGGKFISNKYTLLGKPDEIREEDAVELVHKVEGYNPVLKEFHPAYRLYKGRIIRATHTAKESLLSLLESEIYWDVNPFPYERTESEIIADNLNHCRFMTKEESKFCEAEKKTFDRNRSIIFKKV